jgi:hypothetical protein
VDVNCQSYDGANERAKLEDRPEDAKRLPLVFFEWVAHHDCALRGPKQRRRYAEHPTSKYDEPARSLGLVTSPHALSAHLVLE